MFDIRYFEDHRLGTGQPVSMISIEENFSRAILASFISSRCWAGCRECGDPTDLDRLFRLQATRVLNGHGCVRYRH